MAESRPKRKLLDVDELLKNWKADDNSRSLEVPSDTEVESSTTLVITFTVIGVLMAFGCILVFIKYTILAREDGRIRGSPVSNTVTVGETGQPASGKIIYIDSDYGSPTRGQQEGMMYSKQLGWGSGGGYPNAARVRIEGLASSESQTSVESSSSSSQ